MIRAYSWQGVDMNDPHTVKPEQPVKPLRNALFRHLVSALRMRSRPSRQTPSEQLLRESRDER
jgi:hypothetical protein